MGRPATKNNTKEKVETKISIENINADKATITEPFCETVTEMKLNMDEKISYLYIKYCLKKP